jgi:hypothetical protein
MVFWPRFATAQGAGMAMTKHKRAVILLVILGHVTLHVLSLYSSSINRKCCHFAAQIFPVFHLCSRVFIDLLSRCDRNPNSWHRSQVTPPPCRSRPTRRCSLVMAPASRRALHPRARHTTLWLLSLAPIVHPRRRAARHRAHHREAIRKRCVADAHTDYLSGMGIGDDGEFQTLCV